MMRVLIVGLLSLAVLGSSRSYKENSVLQNQRLKKTNQVLLRALRELSSESESQVGQIPMPEPCNGGLCPENGICFEGYCQYHTAEEESVGRQQCLCSVGYRSRISRGRCYCDRVEVEAEEESEQCTCKVGYRSRTSGGRCYCVPVSLNNFVEDTEEEGTEVDVGYTEVNCDSMMGVDHVCPACVEGYVCSARANDGSTIWGKCTWQQGCTQAWIGGKPHP